MGPSGGWSDELVCQALSKRVPQQNLGPAAQEEPGRGLAVLARNSGKAVSSAARPEEYGCAVVGPLGVARAQGVWFGSASFSGWPGRPGQSMPISDYTSSNGIS